MTQFGQYPAPRFVIAHLSDPHLLAGRLKYDVPLDDVARLRQALDRLRKVRPAPGLLVFTGDLADRGEPAAYARLRELVEPVAAELGAGVVWTMGNHDERAAFSAGLFGQASEAPQDAVHQLDGLRVVALDTSVPGYHHGALEEAQLAWLAEVLATPAEHGTILAMHHPPIPVPMCEVAALIELDDQGRLAEVLAGSDVRAILGGHFHFTSWSTFAGIPVSVAAATCYTTDPAPDPEYLLTGVDGHQAFTMVHVYDDRIVHSVVPVASAPIVLSTEAALGELAATMPRDQMRDQVSRKDSEFNTGVPVDGVSFT